MFVNADATRVIIAVVDDDPRILGSLKDLLESADYIVRVFASATALLESRCLEDVDFLISDIAMPVMDGFELVRIAHATRPTLPIILMSGQAHILNGLPRVLRGHYRVIKKPFAGHELLGAVSDALGNVG
ncbi:MAG TPA: response regulator [Longimicrobiales bacterium]|nr:response regulator [Longimicrobiales bacterium]